jgi:hypothetical protein
MFGDLCTHMQWVLRLRNALDSHERLHETRITPVLMINLLWKVYQDSRQFFVGCERWEDGEPFPRSTLRATVQALVDDIHISTMLTCPVTEFLGTTMPSLKSDWRDPGATTRTAAGYGKQAIKNPSIPPICAPAVRELNNLYPSLDISQFLCRSGVPYSGARATARTLRCLEHDIHQPPANVHTRAQRGRDAQHKSPPGIVDAGRPSKKPN